MADPFPPTIRSEQATRPLLYELGGTVVGGGNVAGDRVGGGGASRVGVAVAIRIGVVDGIDVASLRPQANSKKLSPMTVRITVEARLRIIKSSIHQC